MHAEYASPLGTSVISPLECPIYGTSIDVQLAEGSLLFGLHSGSSPAQEDSPVTVTEEAQCNYGLQPTLSHLANRGGMQAVGVDTLGEVRAVEVVDHPFFVATLYLPQFRSTPDKPHPIFEAFVEAAFAAVTQPALISQQRNDTP